MTSKTQKLGLALSGGGYRAAAFHLGTLKKLAEMNILDRVDVMSTISGGSITGAAWCLHKGDYNSFHKEMVRNLQTKSVIRYIFRSWVFIRTVLFIVIFLGSAIVFSLTKLAWLTFPVIVLFVITLMMFQFKIFPVSKVIERAYDKFFYQKQTLNDLKDKPLLAIGTSNLHTGRPFTFSQNSMTDSTYAFGYNPPVNYDHSHFPVSRAVMASSCVPFAFTPVTIDKEFYTTESDFHRVAPILVDGGVYDNQGIHKLTQTGSRFECKIVIVSDAGGNFLDVKKYKNTFALLLRTVDLFMYRIKTAQMVQNIYHNIKLEDRSIAYYSLGWRVQNTVSGFYKNLCEGQISKEVLIAHEFQNDWISEPQSFEKEITQYLKQRVGLDSIQERDLPEKDWAIARRTSTNLTKLSAQQLEYLIRHAENMTELQVKLYCPTLIKFT